MIGKLYIYNWVNVLKLAETGQVLELSCAERGMKPGDGGINPGATALTFNHPKAMASGCSQASAGAGLYNPNFHLGAWEPLKAILRSLQRCAYEAHCLSCLGTSELLKYRLYLVRFFRGHIQGALNLML
jgi:hypothetical protein